MRVTCDSVAWEDVRTHLDDSRASSTANSTHEYPPLVVRDAARLGEVHTATLAKVGGKLGCRLLGGAGTVDSTVFFSSVADRHAGALAVGDRLVAVGDTCAVAFTRSEASAALQAQSPTEARVTVFRDTAKLGVLVHEPADILQVNLPAADARYLCLVELDEIAGEARLFVESTVKTVTMGDRLLAVNGILTLHMQSDDVYNLLDDLQRDSSPDAMLVMTVARLGPHEGALAFELPEVRASLLQEEEGWTCVSVCGGRGKGMKAGHEC